MSVLQFEDQSGNPIAAGLFVILSSSGEADVEGYIGVGGTITATLVATVWDASFTGVQSRAPATPISFTATGSSQTITVPNYASPVRNQVGYANFQTALWPRDWFSPEARTNGGIAYAIALALADEYQDIREQIEAVILNARLESSVGQNVDSWVTDFFGPNLPREAGELDPAYINRAEVNLGARKSTPAGVLAVAELYGTASVAEPFLASQMGALGSPLLACGSPNGGIGSMIPQPQVYIAPPSTLDDTEAAEALVQLMNARPVGMNALFYQVASSDATPL